MSTDEERAAWAEQTARETQRKLDKQADDERRQRETEERLRQQQADEQRRRRGN